MKEQTSAERKLWQNVTNMLGDNQKTLGRHWSYNLFNDPKRLAFVLSRYKFAAKMACRNKRVLELGCSEGIGTPILSEFATNYTGVDMDGAAIEIARANWGSEKCQFLEGDFLGRRYGRFDSVVSLDVIEHIYPEYEDAFFNTISQNLGHDGICVIGTPNLTASAYASPASQAGHVNLYDAERLAESMQTVFHNVLRFGINDEVVHTGYAPMAHYLVYIGCYKRGEKG
ncbi:MAG: methyltransferase domain-containing protein [Candidatus Poribacteria bacterium]|nr:methyltransferase domain-containing protein [Candidatus Poribacteria bacterium]